MTRRALPGVLLVLAWGLAIAQTPPPGAPGEAKHLDRLAILLDLSDTQKLQLQQVFEAQHASMQAMRQQQLSSDQKPSFAQMKAAREQLHQQLLTKVQPYLSADQFKKFQVLEEHPPPHRWHHGPPPQGAPPSP